MNQPEKRRTLANNMLQQIDYGELKVMVIKDAKTATPRSYLGDVPFWNKNVEEVTTPDQTDPAAQPLVLAEMEQMRLRLAKCGQPMTYTQRHVDADEMIFVHQGSGRILTEVGVMDAPTGRFIFIPRAVAYRIEPQSDDFTALILESEVDLVLTEQVDQAELKLTAPTFSIPPEDTNGQDLWEERVITRSWSASAMREHDPVRTKQIVGEYRLVFGIDVDDIPASKPDVPKDSGYPFGLFESSILSFEVSKRTVSLPFYHRNTRRNELEFVHRGVGDQDTDLGYLSAPKGTLYNLPKDIEHAPCNRVEPQVNLIMETAGDITINPEILG